MMVTQARVGVDITAQDRTSPAFMSATRTLQKFGSVAGAALKGFAVGIASAALIRGLNATITRMDDLTASAKKVGESTEVLSRLAYAAQLSELPFETLLQTSKKLNQNLAEIGAGKDGDAASAMKALGITAFDSEGKLKSVDQVIVDVAEKFSLYKDGANKAALASALFGKKAGPEMIPLLNGGAQAIADAKAEADAFGLTLSGPASEAASVFNDNMDRMSGFVQGVAQTVVSAFLPAANEMIDTFFQTADAATVSSSIIEGIGQSINIVTKYIQQSIAEWQVMVRWVEAFAEASNFMINGDVGGAMEAFSKASADSALIWEELSEKLAMSEQSVNRMGKMSLPSAQPILEAPSFARGGGAGGGVKTPKVKSIKTDTLASDAARIIEATRTPMEAHMARVAELDKLLNKGYITQGIYNRGFVESQNQYVLASGALNQFTDAAEQSLGPLQEVSDLIQNKFTSGLDSIIDRTSSVGAAFKNMAKGILQDATKMFLHSAIQKLFQPQHALYGGGGGFMSGILGKVLGRLPSFAVGADRVPNDMVARIHKDEMIIPAAGANAVRNGRLTSDVLSVGSNSRSNGPIPINVQYHGEARPRVESARMQDGEMFIVMRQIAMNTTSEVLKSSGFGRNMKQRA
jgi:hypothetical protein